VDAHVLDAEARRADRPRLREVPPECFAAEQRGVAERHFPTKQLLVEATIVRHLTRLADTARTRGEMSEAGAAFRRTFREMVSDAPAKLALVALLDEPAGVAGAAGEVVAAASALRNAVEVLLARGQEAGEVRADATVDEVYVLIRALAHARGDRTVVERAVDVVLDGLSPRHSGQPSCG
jgi:phage tail sheath gpL-like